MSPYDAEAGARASSSPRARWGGDFSPPRASLGKKIALMTAVAMIATFAPPLTGTGVAAPAGSVSIVPPLNIEALNICTPFAVQTDIVDALVDVEVVSEDAAAVEFCDPTAPDVVNPVLIDPTTGDLGAGPTETDGDIGGEATTGAGGPDGGGVFTFGVSSATAATFDITAFGEDGVGNDDPDSGEPTATAQWIVLAVGGGEDQEPVPGATQLVTNLDCVPETDSRPSGATQTFFCQATGGGDAPILGAEVSFDVTDGPNSDEVGSTACTVTDSNGASVCEYTDSLGAGSPDGTDTILGYADLDSASPGPEIGAPDDEIRTSFGVSQGASKVKSRVSIKRKFQGSIKSAVGKCKKARKVKIKKVRKGRDKVVARDKTNKRGKYKVRKRKAHGRFYAVAKRRKITAQGGTVVCKAGKSKTVRRR